MIAESKHLINLIEFSAVGLILKVPSGVFYTNQSGGYACEHPEIEGVFYPLPVKPGNAELSALTQHFNGTWGHINETDVEFIDRMLRSNGHSALSVDQTKVDQSYDAWVHIKVKAGCEDLCGFGNCEGVLIWPNSD